MSSSDRISPLSSAPTVLTPELDRAVLHPSQLTRFYTLQEVRQVTPIAYRDGPPAASASQAVQAERGGSRPERGAARLDHRQGEPRSARRGESAETSAASPRLPPPRDAAHSTTLSERSAVARAEGPRRMTSAECGADVPDPKAEPLPYGADPVRIRALVEEIVNDRAFVPFTFQYRQAGDLVPVAPGESAKPYASVRQVNAIYKAV